ncbi:MAG: PDDEXK nuclease domain-containing protein [Bacteroidota bacterium]|nr:PDDEXK nuclease domain-containing protein [Bacteroidota bacterium]
MEFNQLIDQIATVSLHLQKRALQSVDQLLVMRNWLIGFYVVEYEQAGTDRAKYGDKLLEAIESDCKRQNLKGLSVTNLKLCRQFYQVYPAIGQPLADSFAISQPVADQLIGNSIMKNLQQVGITIQQDNHSEIQPEIMLQHFSFRHFTELVKVKDPLKRLFYEHQAIKGNWSARELKRQIDSLLIERAGLSTDKKKLLASVNGEINQPEHIIKDPYILEFTGFKDLPVYNENDLEIELLNKIQSFLLELGNGFCFEARQKRITVGNEHDRIDLVFYHRILKCHVLFDLKVRAFSHADVGQMNYYLNYYKKNMKETGDSDPVGIVLCTRKDHEKVQYATAGLDNHLFVSKYMLALPTEEELLALVKY